MTPCPQEILSEGLLMKGLGEQTELDSELAEHPRAGLEMSSAKSNNLQ